MQVSTFYFYLHKYIFSYLRPRKLKFLNYFYFLQCRILGKYLYLLQSKNVINFW